MSFNLDQSSLIPFVDVAAGHEGTLSDPSGTLFIKPCTQPEIAFYEAVAADHPDLHPHIPLYMGTLTLGESRQDDQDGNGSGARETKGPKAGRSHDRDPGRTEPDTAHLHGARIESPHHVVLANVAAGFARPNVLDIKLGARLWADSAPPAKRQRLDAVAKATTSGTLGARLAGMRIWEGEKAEEEDEAEGEARPANGNGEQAHKDDDDEEQREHRAKREHSHLTDGWRFYDKLYGRSLSAPGLQRALRRFFLASAAVRDDRDTAREVAECCAALVTRLREVLERTEVRLISTSVLVVCEGDGQELRRKMDEFARWTERERAREAKGEEDEDEDEDDEDEEPVFFRVKLIDFAHANMVPGQGPDENVLQGLRNVENMFNETVKQLGGSSL